MPYSDPAKQLEYQRQWMAKRRAEYLADKSCAVCGSTAQLEIDHIDPTQKFTHRIFGYSVERQREELAKCQVLCRQHHMEKSANESRARNYQRYHGQKAA